MIQLMLDQLAGLKGKIADVDKEIAQRARGNEVTRRLMTIPAGSDGETNFGKTSVAAPQAASSSVARYSFTARLDLAGSRSLRQSFPAIERCLLASAAIRLASTAKPSPPTRPAATHVSTTRSNMRRKTSPSRKHSLRARENAE
jgi:transposase